MKTAKAADQVPRIPRKRSKKDDAPVEAVLTAKPTGKEREVPKNIGELVFVTNVPLARMRF